MAGKRNTAHRLTPNTLSPNRRIADMWPSALPRPRERLLKGLGGGTPPRRHPHRVCVCRREAVQVACRKPTARSLEVFAHLLGSSWPNAGVPTRVFLASHFGRSLGASSNTKIRCRLCSLVTLRREGGALPPSRAEGGFCRCRGGDLPASRGVRLASRGVLPPPRGGSAAAEGGSATTKGGFCHCRGGSLLASRGCSATVEGGFCLRRGGGSVTVEGGFSSRREALWARTLCARP